MVNFTDELRLALENDACERLCAVPGRNNTTAHAPTSAEAAALFSLVESAKLASVEPGALTCTLPRELRRAGRAFRFGMRS